MGLATEQLQRQAADQPRAPGRLRARPATSGAAAANKEVAWPTRSSRSRCPSARVTRCSSTPTRACGPGRRPSHSAGCGPPSTRTAPSPPGTRRRSPTAAAAVIVMSAAKAEELGLAPLGEVVGYGMVAGPDTSLLTQPSRAIVKARGQGGRRPRRRRPVRDQRGLRRRRAGLDRRPRHRRGQGQRQRWRHRPRAPGRHVGHPGGARRHCSSSRRRGGLDCGSRPLRRRRPGRRCHPAGSLRT